MCDWRALLAGAMLLLGPGLAAAQAPTWEQLTAGQQQVLGTLPVEFNALPPLRREALARSAEQVLQMPPRQRQRVIEQLRKRAAQREILQALTPEARQRVRERFRQLQQQPGGVAAACPGPPDQRLACLLREAPPPSRSAPPPPR